MPKTVNVVTLLTICTLSGFCFLPLSRAEHHDSTDHLEIISDFGADCVSRNALQLLIVNNHPSKPIKAKLFRYYGEVRQPGRSAYVLQPGAEPLALGCDKIQGRAQYWQISASNYVDQAE